MKKGISAISVVNLVICSGVVLQGLLLEIIMFRLLLFHLHHQIVLLLVVIFVRIICMLLPFSSEFEATSNVVTGMLQLFSYDVYFLLDLGSTLSYVTPYVAMYFGFGPKHTSDPFFVSTPVGDFVVSRKVYRGCVVYICGRETLVDLIELDMLDFDIILRID